MRLLRNVFYTSTLLLFLLQVSVSAQQMLYGIQAHVFINPPYPLDLFEYTNTASNKMWVQIIPDQNSRPIDVRMRVHFDELTGKFSIATRASFIPVRPIQLVGGIPVTLMTADLAPYLSIENLEVTTGNAAEFLLTKRLPEGNYKIWVEVISSRGETLSDNKIGSRIAMLVQNDAPQWVTPQNNKTLTASEPQNVLFTWQLGSLVNAVTNIEYQFTIVELPSNNVDKYVAIKSLTPLLVTNTRITSFRYDYMSPQLIPGRTYAYQVKASTIEGSSFFKYDGYSNVQSFTWGSPCNTPQQIQCTFDSYSTEKVAWQPTGSKQFDVTYREISDTSASEWYTDRATDDLIDVSNNIYAIIHYLKPARIYECKVKAWCGSVTSEYSPVISFKTQQKVEEDVKKTCEANAGIIDTKLLKHTSTQTLSVGEEIEVGGFKAKITELTTNAVDTTYTGKCIVYVNTFGIKVASHFSNIKVNTDKKVFSGEIIAEYDPNNLVNKDAIIADLESTVAEVDQAVKELKSLVSDAKIYFAGDPAIIDIISNYDTVTVLTPEIKEGFERVNEAIKVENLGRQLISQGRIAEGEAKLISSTIKKEEGKQILKEMAITGVTIEKENLVTFKYSPAQIYGFDGYDAVKLPLIKYYETSINNGNILVYPWKSMSSGVQDEMLFEKDGSLIEPIQFETKEKMQVTQVNEKLEFQVNNSTYVKAFKKLSDSKGHDSLISVGKINVACYPHIVRKVVIVFVNNASADISNLGQSLDKIYSPANVAWNIENGPNLSVPEIEGKTFSIDPEAYSSYSAEMDSVKSAFIKQNPNYDAKTSYYLFIIPNPSNVEGYMPLSQRWGFAFSSNPNGATPRIIGHLLGHGVFRLRHTYNQAISIESIEQGKTNNLMDNTTNTTSTSLWKNQWDLIHDPSFSTYFFQSQ